MKKIWLTKDNLTIIQIHRMEEERKANKLAKGHLFGLIKYSNYEIASQFEKAAITHYTQKNNKSALINYKKAVVYHIKDGNFTDAADCNYSMYKLTADITYLIASHELVPERTSYFDDLCNYYIREDDHTSLIKLYQNAMDIFSSGRYTYTKRRVDVDYFACLAIYSTDEKVNQMFDDNKQNQYICKIMNSYKSCTYLDSITTYIVNPLLVKKFNKMIDKKIMEKNMILKLDELESNVKGNIYDMEELL